ncbi:MAG: glycosyltransferase family 39 protein [Magnetospirillum sp.]|nr:glycosyltransferase family 39 protein [Magnetospirillum sp.]
MDKLTGGLRPYLLLSLLCLVLYGPGLAAVPPLDRDESRFMQASKQMLESGDFVRIQFQNEMRAKKPVGAYWLQAASVALFSHPQSQQVWPYRLPSLLAAWAAVLMTFGFGRPLIGARPALIGAGLLATALILVTEAHQAKADAVLLACMVAAQGVLVRVYVTARAREAAGGGGAPNPVPSIGIGLLLLFWAAQGFGVLVKGPMVPLVSLLTALTLSIADRSGRWLVMLRPMSGVVVAAAIAAPWFAAISNATGGAFVGAAVKGDLLPKLLGAQESHGGWPGTYLLLASLTFWPGSLFLWPALVRAWSQRHRLALRALLAWIVPVWLMFELVPTKLPHYVLPVFPALALLTGALLCEGAEAFRHRATRLWYALWTLIGMTLAGAVVAAPILLGSGFDAASIPAAVAIVLATLLPVVLAWRGALMPAALALALSAAATYPVVFQGVLPRLQGMFLSRAVAEVVDSLGAPRPVAIAGISEPSLVFLLGTDTVLTDAAGAAAHLVRHPQALAVVTTREDDAFRAAAAAQGGAVVELGRVDGVNVSRGKRVSLGIYGAGGR